MAAGGPEREDLAELLARRALTEDAARPEAVKRRHDAGLRTARENIADLVDPGSFVEYGRFAIAAQRGSLHEPLLTVAWPSAHLGPMGLEGAVRLRCARSWRRSPTRPSASSGSATSPPPPRRTPRRSTRRPCSSSTT